MVILRHEERRELTPKLEWYQIPRPCRRVIGSRLWDGLEDPLKNYRSAVAGALIAVDAGNDGRSAVGGSFIEATDTNQLFE